MSKSVSTGSANVAALAKAVAAPGKKASAKGAPTASGESKFEEALSQAMPVGKNKASEPQGVKSGKAKQPADSAQNAEPSESVESSESGESDKSGEAVENEGQPKRAVRKSVRSTKAQEEPTAESNLELVAMVTVQANPTEAISPETPSLEDAAASGASSSAAKVEPRVSFSTQAMSELPVDETAVTMSSADVQPLRDGLSDEISASAESGIPMDGMDVAGQADLGQPAADPAIEEAPFSTPDPVADVMVLARPPQEASIAPDEGEITGGEHGKPAGADRIVATSASAEVSDVLPDDPAGGADEQSADADEELTGENWTSERDMVGGMAKPLLQEEERKLAKPAAHTGERVPAESVAVAAPVSHIEQAPKPIASPTQPSMESRFAEINHPKVVTAVRSELMPDGGTMEIRLDPPELGALQVRVEMRDGVLTASFQTASDDATRLLSHSLHQLRTALESQGVSVERLHVEQVSREKLAGGMSEDGQQQQQSQDRSSQQEQQRREMLQRMWRRLAGGKDPLDLMA